MRIAEKILALAFIIGIVLQFSFVSVDGEIALIPLLTLARIYYPPGFPFLIRSGYGTYSKSKLMNSYRG